MIKEAAIKRISDGKIWTGHRHDNCFNKILWEEFYIPKDLIDGFITDIGEFLDRKEVFKHAVICNQVEDPNDGKERGLISEDLY